MERKITPDDIRKSANEAFEKAKAMNEEIGRAHV